MKKINTRLAVSRPEGGFCLRVYAKPAGKRRSPRLIVKCGCCDEKISIYYGDGFLEINGVMGTVENWKEVLDPLLMRDAGKKKRTRGHEARRA